jgi:H-type lectin domain
MSRNNDSNWQNQVNFYERALAELKRTREELQAELDSVKQMKADLATLPQMQENLANYSKEIHALKSQIHSAKSELESTKMSLQNTQESLQDEIKVTQIIANNALLNVESAKNKLNKIELKLEQIKNHDIYQAQERLSTTESALNLTKQDLINLQSNQKFKLESGVFWGNADNTEGWTGVLWEGPRGHRFIRQHIKFAQPFSQVPKVVLGLHYIDISKTSNHRINIMAKDINSYGFFLEIHTYYGTQVFGAGVNWFAYS